MPSGYAIGSASSGAYEFSLNLLNKLRKRDQMKGLPSILSLFRNEFNKSLSVRFYLSYDIKITLKSHFFVILLSLCTLRCYGHHNVARKSVNH